MNDRALSFHWKSRGILDALAILKPSSFNDRAVFSSLLTEAHLTARGDRDQWTSYSRRKGWWAARSRYRGLPFTYTSVTSTVDYLADKGLLESVIAAPGSRGVQSVFRASEALMEALVGHRVDVVHEPAETILLRRDGELLEYRDTDHTRRLRRSLAALNEALVSVVIGHPELGDVRPGDPIHFNDRFLGLARQSLHRVFTETFQRHGRFYGGWWQNIPKDKRPHLTIGGEPTVEVDFPALHPTILYALAGVGSSLHGEPYEVDGFPRRIAKIAFAIVINSRMRSKAIHELATKLAGPDGHWGPHRSTAERIIAETEKRHSPIRDLFYAGLGLDLMAIDSMMAEGILQRLARRGIVALPLHDGFRGKVAQRDEILEEMAVALDEMKSKVSYGKIRRIGSSDLHMPPALLPAPLDAPDLCPDDLAASNYFFLRDVGQMDMFGRHRLDLPVLDLLGWIPGRPIPRSILLAVSHVSRRRKLLQRDIASIVGTSRPHLANVLQGRRPTSPAIVDNLRRLILSEAETVSGYRRVA